MTSKKDFIFLYPARLKLYQNIEIMMEFVQFS